MTKNVYITNFWYTRHNYGANLTAFALQSILEKVHLAPYLVNNSLKSVEHKNRRFKFSFDFQKKYLKTTKHVDKNPEFLNKDGEIFITGSDQVFRPKYMRGKPEQYLLDFVKPDKKKIAFSASFGVDKKQFLEENSQDVVDHMKNSLKSFDFISVREKEGVDICKDLFGIEAEWIIDPVFILEKEKWGELIEDITPHPNPLPQGARELSSYKNKIVSYVLDASEEYDRAYKYLEEKYNKSIVRTMNTNISIEDWLASIRDCDLFVTDSFHGMCFALIFNKPFICLANKKRGSSRFESICEMLGIENQCIESISEVMDRDCVFKIDYSKVNEQIVYESQRGLEFLNKAIDAPIKITQEKIDARMRYLETRVSELEKQNNLSYQLWQIWRTIFIYLPEPIKKIFSFLWQIIKRVK